MTEYTKFSGYVRRYSGDYPKTEHRFSVEDTITEGGEGRIKVAPGSLEISIMPHGLIKATSVFIETDYKINVTVVGETNASMDVLANGIFMLTGSLSNVKLANRAATPTANVFYDITG